MPKMAKNGQKCPKKNQLKKRWKLPDPPPPKMEIKLIRKINLRKDGNRRTPPQRWKISIFSYLKASLTYICIVLINQPLVQSADPLPSPAVPGHPLLLRPAVLDEQQVDLQVTKGPVIGVTEAL